MMFPGYPDIVNVRQLQEMLGISRKLAYAMINDGDIPAIKIGISYKIPKVNIIRFVIESQPETAGGRKEK